MEFPLNSPLGDEEEGREQEGFPFPLTSSLKILGVTIDAHSTVDEHFQTIMSKAPIRQVYLRRVANASWGLETGVLRVAH